MFSHHFSLPVQNIVILASVSTLLLVSPQGVLVKVFNMMGKALSGELSCTLTGLVSKGNLFHDFLFASLAGKTLPKGIYF